MDAKRTDEPGSKRSRRVLVVAGWTLAALILVAVAVYAVAFLMLAPMMQ
ncbi:hypothetical protein [uncultured Mycolicibacterium sp.]